MENQIVGDYLSTFTDLISAIEALKQNKISAPVFQKITEKLASASLDDFLNEFSRSLAPSEIIAGYTTFSLLRHVASILIHPDNPNKNPNLALKIYERLIGAENAFLKEIENAEGNYREKLEKALLTAGLSLGADWHDKGVALELSKKLPEARRAYQAAFNEDMKHQGESTAKRMMAWRSLARLTAIDAAVLNQNKFSLSAFVTAWISIEMSLRRLWLIELGRQGCDGILQECLKEFEIFHIIGSLGKLKMLSKHEVKELNRFRKIRNKAVHFEKSPDHSTTQSCWRFALDFADKEI